MQEENSQARAQDRWLTASLLIAALAVLAWVMKVALGEQDIPRQLLLTSAAVGWAPASFRVGNGHHYNLLIGLPLQISSREVGFGGFVAISDDQGTSLSIPFEIGAAPRASWLREVGLEGYILTWQTNLPSFSLDGFFKPGRVYTIIVVFSNTPPGYGSLWCTYLQDWRHRQNRAELVKHGK